MNLTEWAEHHDAMCDGGLTTDMEGDPFCKEWPSCRYPRPDKAGAREAIAEAMAIHYGYRGVGTQCSCGQMFTDGWMGYRVHVADRAIDRWLRG